MIILGIFIGALEFMRNGKCAEDWYDLWYEDNFEEAAKNWPEANYFADIQMFAMMEEE